jgi:hypothetical protein
MNQQTLKWKLFPFSLVGEQRNGTIPKLEAWREVGSSLEKNFV